MHGLWPNLRPTPKHPGYNIFERIRSQFYILKNLCTEKIKEKSAMFFITFPCGFRAKNEERESKTTQKMVRVKDRGGGEDTLGARDFSCAVFGFGQVLKSDPCEKFFLAASPLVSLAYSQQSSS